MSEFETKYKTNSRKAEAIASALVNNKELTDVPKRFLNIGVLTLPVSNKKDCIQIAAEEGRLWELPQTLITLDRLLFKGNCRLNCIQLAIHKSEKSFFVLPKEAKELNALIEADINGTSSIEHLLEKSWGRTYVNKALKKSNARTAKKDKLKLLAIQNRLKRKSTRVPLLN